VKVSSAKRQVPHAGLPFGARLGFKPTHIEDSVELALAAVNHELRAAAQFRRITIAIDGILVQQLLRSPLPENGALDAMRQRMRPRQTLQQLGLARNLVS